MEPVAFNATELADFSVAGADHHDGTIELVHYADRAESLQFLPATIPSQAA